VPRSAGAAAGPGGRPLPDEEPQREQRASCQRIQQPPPDRAARRAAPGRRRELGRTRLLRREQREKFPPQPRRGCWYRQSIQLGQRDAKGFDLALTVRAACQMGADVRQRRRSGTVVEQLGQVFAGAGAVHR
jgi:hypothetical protein